MKGRYKVGKPALVRLKPVKREAVAADSMICKNAQSYMARHLGLSKKVENRTPLQMRVLCRKMIMKKHPKISFN
jgi:hypothetical protein